MCFTSSRSGPPIGVGGTSKSTGRVIFNMISLEVCHTFQERLSFPQTVNHDFTERLKAWNRVVNPAHWGLSYFRVKIKEAGEWGSQRER